MIGWIKLTRKIAETSFYLGEQFDHTRCLLDLILLAEWKEKRSFFVRGIRVDLHRGQVAMPIRELAQRWGMTDKPAMKRLKFLEKEGLISVKRSSTINIITLSDALMCDEKRDVNDETPTQTPTQNEVQNDAQNRTQAPIQAPTQPPTQAPTLSLRKEKNIKKNKNINTACVRTREDGDGFFYGDKDNYAGNDSDSGEEYPFGDDTADGGHTFGKYHAAEEECTFGDDTADQEEKGRARIRSILATMPGRNRTQVG